MTGNFENWEESSDQMAKEFKIIRRKLLKHDCRIVLISVALSVAIILIAHFFFN